MATEKREIKRINVFSTVKTLFLVGGVCGFVLGIVKWSLLGMILGILRGTGRVSNEIIPELDQLFGAGISMLGFLMPVAGAVFGAIGGVVFGFLLAGVYNSSARLWGGIEVELAELSMAPARSTVSGRPVRTATSSLEASPLPSVDRTAEDKTRNEPPDTAPPTFE